MWCISTIKFSILINGTQLIFLEAQGVFVKGTHYLHSFLILSWRL